MQHAILISLNVLMILEPALAVCALLACLRAGTSNPVPAMRDYLALRAANTIAVAIVLLWPGESLLLSVRTTLLTLIYFFWFWGVSFALLFLEMRVAAGSIAVFFRDLPGLQGLFRLASRWIAITGVIVVIPLLLAVAANFSNHAYHQLIRRWWYAFSLLELMPAVFALAVGKMRKVPWSSRAVAILFGFAFEPLVHLLGPWSWTSKTSMLQLVNIAHEVACCAAVALWAVCYTVPEKSSSLARPTPAMLRLDELARMTLRPRPAVAREPMAARKGAQPWPKYRRDA